MAKKKSTNLGILFGITAAIRNIAFSLEYERCLYHCWSNKTAHEKLKVNHLKFLHSGCDSSPTEVTGSFAIDYNDFTSNVVLF